MSYGVETKRQVTPEQTVLNQGVEVLSKLFKENSRGQETIYDFQVTERDFPNVEALEQKLRQIRQEEKYPSKQNHKLVEHGRLILLKDKKFDEKMWVMPLRRVKGMTAHIGRERVHAVSEETAMMRQGLFKSQRKLKEGDEFKYMVERKDASAELFWEILVII